MKLHLLITILIVSSILINCKNTSDSFTEFPIQKNIIGEVVDDISIYSSGNVYLAVIDTFLVIQSNTEKYFQIYSTNTHKLLTEFGTEGRGPNEFLGPSLKKQITIDEETQSPIALAFDFRKQTAHHINIFEALENNDQAISQLPLYGNNQFLVFFHYYNNEFFIATPEANARLVMVQADNSKTVAFPYTPKPDFEIKKPDLSSVYKSAVLVNEEKKLIAAAPLLLPQLDFFDFKGNYIRSTKLRTEIEHHKELESGMNFWENIQANIADINAVGDSIFALNYNNAIAKYYTEDRENNMTVQVFNWSGDKVVEYSLADRRYIQSFAVDPIHSRIYGYDPNEENFNIVSYSYK